MFLHAIRSGLTFEQFVEGVKFYCMGDDLIISDRTGLFTAERVADTYRSMGLYLECRTKFYHTLWESSFCGTHPVRRRVFGTMMVLPLFRTEKLLDSLRWRRIDSSVTDFVCKLVSVLVLVYADEEVYLRLRRSITEWVRENVDLTIYGHRLGGALAILYSESRVVQIVTGLESECPPGLFSFTRYLGIFSEIKPTLDL